MKLKSLDQSIFRTCLSVLLISVLSSCGSKPTHSSSTSLSPQPTDTEPAATSDESSLLKAGLNYSDPSGDMPISFLDVVAFQAAVNEEAEILEVLLHMRDVPETAPREQAINVFEYFWLVFVYLDPSKTYPADIPGDYYFGLNTKILDPARQGSNGLRIPVPGTPVNVPFSQLFENKSVYSSTTGERISTLNAVADPDADTITWTGHVPGIKSNALFSFDMTYYDGTKDTPENLISSGPSDLSTPLAEASQLPPIASTVAASDDAAQLKRVGAVRAYPGARHYAGDVLTFEIQTDGSFDENLTVSMTLDNMPAIHVSAKSNYLNLLLPLALDTMNLTGPHTVKFRTAEGHLNETYTFEVLSADERPANEENAEWLVNETDCCLLHYVSETAAARDIDFIAEHFQQAAEDFSTITGADIDPKLDIYIMDRIWGNGGFGGNGELVISYTDRYYGPTIGGEGLETLARHEFSHAADIGLSLTGDGVLFNYEGMAVYIAGGHYKPEPLAERGAALYDLGHYVPVGQFLDQHELSYLYSAAMLTYVVETYGSEKMWEFLAADENPDDDQPGSLEGAIQSTFGVSLSEFDQDFQAWLENKEPGEQLEDLRLTIELQNLRRQYQDTYSPPPYFLLARAEDAAARPEYIPVVMREANAAPNMAVELIIAHGQQAIIDGNYTRAEELIEILREIVSTGKFEDPSAKDYLDIVLVAAGEGYEVLNLDIQGDQASAGVTAEPPTLIDLSFQKTDGTWQIQP